MKTDIAEQWSTALESGEYEQGQGSLNRDGQYCCLGVLCELALKAGVDIEVSREGDLTVYDGEDGALPMSVMDWSGVSNSSGWFVDGEAPLTTKNDSGISFLEIARTIRENKETL